MNGTEWFLYAIRKYDLQTKKSSSLVYFNPRFSKALFLRYRALKEQRT